MSAKHKRPFYVFAAVAAVCCMVLVTGIRSSRADDGGSPVVSDSLMPQSGALIEPSPGAGDITPSDVGREVTGGASTGLDGDLDATIPGLDNSVTVPDGGDAEAGPESGVSLLPPFGHPLQPVDVDPDDATIPPVSDDTDGKGRGARDGKKDKGKDKDEEDDASEAVAEAEAEAEEEEEEEVDPDVYGLPEDVGDEGDDGAGESEQAEEPVDPEVTP